jgi:hypothetical protein
MPQLARPTLQGPTAIPSGPIAARDGTEIDEPRAKALVARIDTLDRVRAGASSNPAQRNGGTFGG